MGEAKASGISSTRSLECDGAGRGGGAGGGVRGVPTLVLRKCVTFHKKLKLNNRGQGQGSLGVLIRK